MTHHTRARLRWEVLVALFLCGVWWLGFVDAVTYAAQVIGGMR